MLNGITAHAFAAIMTATVVVFPTPKDFWQTVTGSENPIVASRVSRGPAFELPHTLTERTTTQEANETLAVCSTNFRSLTETQVADCQGFMAYAARQIGSAVRSPEIEVLDQRLRLSITVYCRHKWASALGVREDFDPDTCQNGLARLADPA